MSGKIYILAATALILTSCTNKDKSTTAPATSTTATTTVTPTPAPTRYDTVSYKGTYSDQSWAYAPPGEYGSTFIGNTTDPAFVFRIAQINDTSFVLWSESNLGMLGNTRFLDIIDTFRYNSANSYLFGPVISRNGNATVTGPDSLTISNNLINFGWSYERPICADYEYHYCHFTGNKQ